MPVIGIPVNMLLERIRVRLEPDALVEHLQHLGCDVEGYATVRRFHCRRCDNMTEITETENPPVVCDRCAADFREQPELLAAMGQADVIRMELLAVRPDMFEPGGLARVLRHYLGEQEEPSHYDVAPPQWRVAVAPEVRSDACPRPNIACAIVRGITLTEDRIKVIMKLQENLHWALGRDRKRASIGVYDLDTVIGPTLDYRAVGPDELRFVPLGFDPESADSLRTPAEILETHPKGMAYARLLERFQAYPLLVDRQGQVLSMPPIINSEETRIRQTSTSFFIDVTGTEERIVNKTLNILVTSLAELDPELKLEQVVICYPDRESVTPDLTPQLMTLEPEAAARRIGIALDKKDVERLLMRMGHGVEDAGADGVVVRVPAYRNDIMHPVDLMEDVAIAHGYHNIVPSLVPTFTVGAQLPIEAAADVARATLTGLGYFEVFTLILSSLEANYDSLLREREARCVLIGNPISSDQTLVRTTLLYGILDTLSANASHSLPQHVFEVGNISVCDSSAETGAREIRQVAAGAIGPRVDYAEIRSVCEALLREYGWELSVEPDDCPTFIPGRGARVYGVRNGGRRQLGSMGEVHPQVLENHKLIHPAAVLEVDLETLSRQ